MLNEYNNVNEHFMLGVYRRAKHGVSAKKDLTYLKK